MKRSFWIFPFVTAIVIGGIVILANRVIESATEHAVYSDVVRIPANLVGLLLGTSKTLRYGKPNQYFTNRIDATIQLFNARKIAYVVISGDNSHKYYNEPQDMKDELMKRGLPESKIYLDFAGFRTFDSVYRMHAIFGQTNFTIISQEFHNERALYIAQSLKLHAIAFNAKDVTVYMGIKTKLREKLSRVKMFVDLAFHKKPKFLGDKIEIK
jgi:SanA protein